MSKWGHIDDQGFDDFVKRLKVDAKPEIRQQIDRAMRASGSAMLKQVKALTPYDENGDSPHLKNKWKISSTGYSGKKFYIEIINPLEYASFVESGHRTRAKKKSNKLKSTVSRVTGVRWVEGQFMARDGIKMAMPYMDKRLNEGLEKAIRKIMEG